MKKIRLQDIILKSLERGPRRVSEIKDFIRLSLPDKKEREIGAELLQMIYRKQIERISWGIYKRIV